RGGPGITEEQTAGNDARATNADLAEGAGGAGAVRRRGRAASNAHRCADAKRGAGRGRTAAALRAAAQEVEPRLGEPARRRLLDACGAVLRQEEGGPRSALRPACVAA